jgi:hypothetical protein
MIEFLLSIFVCTRTPVLGGYHLFAISIG